VALKLFQSLTFGKVCAALKNEARQVAFMQNLSAANAKPAAVKAKGSSL